MKRITIAVLMAVMAATAGAQTNSGTDFYNMKGTGGITFKAAYVSGFPRGEKVLRDQIEKKSLGNSGYDFIIGYKHFVSNNMFVSWNFGYEYSSFTMKETDYDEGGKKNYHTMLFPLEFGTFIPCSDKVALECACGLKYAMGTDEMVGCSVTASFGVTFAGAPKVGVEFGYGLGDDTNNLLNGYSVGIFLAKSF